MLVRRVKGMSGDEFHEHWTNKHQAIVKEWLKKSMDA
jgi:ABC-type proline/glycine betaine transport system substrate-binding protein